MFNTILFDLDGTLLPLDQNLFIKNYFKALASYFAPLGFDVPKLLGVVEQATALMFKNDGSATNEEVFWKYFLKEFGGTPADYEPLFEKFYTSAFDFAKNGSPEANPLVRPCIELLKSKGYELILATNPVFPQIATKRRISWAGLEPELFSYITTYDNCTYTKPSHEYYKEILRKCGKTPSECLMVGNDVKEDMSIASLGFDTYLIKDYLINTDNLPIKSEKQGSFTDFYEFAKNIKSIQ